MPLATAQSLGWNLSRTLMTVIVLIETNQGYFVIPADEFDGDLECGSACKKSPVSGVIGVQKGTTIPMI